MAKDKSTLRFWLRTDRAKKNGSAPIHLVYQLHGDKSCYSVKDVNIFPVNWNATDQVAIYVAKGVAKKLAPELDYSMLLSDDDAEEINSKLQEVKRDVGKIEERFRLDNIQYYCEDVIKILKDTRKPLSKKKDPNSNIVDFISKYSKEDKTKKPGTIKAYTGLANHMKGFEEKNKIAFTFENINVSILKEFSNYLTEVAQINDITKAKQLGTLKTLLRRAEDEYDIEVNPKYRKFKNPHPRKDSEFEVIALTQDEFDAIYNLDLTDNRRLDETRDIFCFSCATGLRYSDLAQLSRQHIRKDNVIIMTSEKNSKRIEVPLTPVSYAILQKYSDQHHPLPVKANGKLISNQKLNNNIKDLAKKAEIDTPIEIVREYGAKKKAEVFKKYELLSIHAGRKTFTTLALEKEIPIEAVMALTTHSSYKAMKRYINVTKERKKSVMAKAFGELPNPLKVAK